MDLSVEGIHSPLGTQEDPCIHLPPRPLDLELRVSACPSAGPAQQLDSKGKWVGFLHLPKSLLCRVSLSSTVAGISTKPSNRIWIIASGGIRGARSDTNSYRQKRRMQKHKLGLREAGEGAHWGCWQNSATSQQPSLRGGSGGRGTLVQPKQGGHWRSPPVGKVRSLMFRDVQ